MKVWINGTFDVLHMGHIHLFRIAKEIAGKDGIVRVGLDTDERIKELKGEGRPINKIEDRYEFLKSIKYVDEVVVFHDDDSLRECIRRFGAKLMCIGDDYKDRTIIGEEYFDAITYVKRYGGLSSTKIVNSNKE